MGRRQSLSNESVRSRPRARFGALASAALAAFALTAATAWAQAPAPTTPPIPAEIPLEVPLPKGDGENPAKVDPEVKTASTSAEDPPPPARPAPDAMPAPSEAPIDPAVAPTQAPSRPIPSAAPNAAPGSGPGPGGVPLAVEPPGAAPPTTPTLTREDPAFVLPPERLPFGRQSIGLTVDVVAPQFINIHQTATFKVVVRNNGLTDAMGVVVRDQLPEGLEYIASQPEPKRTDGLLTWELDTIAAGTERAISLSVKPTRVGPVVHAATLALKAGAKYSTQVREPRLKVEVERSGNASKVLKGQPVQFKIIVSNPGDGPVRNVTVSAKLSAGLRHESGEGNDDNVYTYENAIELINSGERQVLRPLVVDAVQGGPQSCVIQVQSEDVVPNLPESRSQQYVTVVEPKLGLTVVGPEERYTDTLASYEIEVTNPGTATAENVQVQATLPVSGRLYATPSGARFDPQSRRLSWNQGPLEPGGKVKYTFQIRMGGVGQYQIGAECRADGGVTASEIAKTNVTGLADVDLTVTENRRYIDVNETTTFVIKVVNRGTADATNLQISGKLTDTIVPIETSGTEKVVHWDEKDTLKFPLIERLGPGKMIELGIKVKAKRPGPAFCRIFLLHDGMKDKQEQIDDVAVCKVLASRR